MLGYAGTNRSLNIFVICKDVPWPEQRCQMSYLGLCKKNRFTVSLRFYFYFSISKRCQRSLTLLPLLLLASTYFLPLPLSPLSHWLVGYREENEVPQGICQTSLGCPAVTNSRVSVAQHGQSFFLPYAKTNVGQQRPSFIL